MACSDTEVKILNALVLWLPISLRIRRQQAQRMPQFVFPILVKNPASVEAVRQPASAKDPTYPGPGSLWGKERAQICARGKNGNPLPRGQGIRAQNSSSLTRAILFKDVHDIFAAGLRFREEFPPGPQHRLSGNSLCRERECWLQGCWVAPSSLFLNIPFWGTPVCFLFAIWAWQRTDMAALSPTLAALTSLPIHSTAPAKVAVPLRWRYGTLHPHWQQSPATPGLCHAGGGTRGSLRRGFPGPAWDTS